MQLVHFWRVINSRLLSACEYARLRFSRADYHRYFDFYAEQ
jgi:hypothetical protein